MTSLNNSNFPISLENIKSLIEKTDDDGVLQIYSYKYCNNDSDDMIKNSRGLVFDGDKLLFKSLGFTPEYNDTNKSKLNNMSINDYKFYKSEEGTLIRIFYYKKWYISTHRKLDAFKSHWSSSDSFGDIFKKSLDKVYPNIENSIEKLTNFLDKEKVYFFLIRNTNDNRIVCRPTSSYLFYYVGNMTHGENGIYSSEIPPEIKYFPRQEELTFSNWDEVFNHVNEIDPFLYQGLIVFDINGNQFKILNTKYQLYSQVRGNEPNLCLRYLQVRLNSSLNNMFLELYPEHKTQFLNYEFIINMIAKGIHNAYMSRFIGKKHVVVSKEAYQIVKECHGWHISDRENNKVTYNQVLNVINHDRFVSTLYHLIKNFTVNGSI